MGNAKRIRRKQAWFEAGVKALQLARPGAPPVYGCPLCVKGFSSESLTDEDVPPKSVGGRPLVLTCACCNNHSGVRIDPHARSGEDLQEFSAGTRTLKVNLFLQQLRIAADMQKVSSGLLFLGIENNSDPAHHKALFQQLDEAVATGSTDWGFTVDVRLKHDAWLEYLSWLRAAYLVAFAALGYTYVLRPELSTLRDQLRTPDAKHLPYLLMKAGAEDVRVRKLRFVFEPAEMQGLSVQFGQRLVFLPGFVSGPDFFNDFKTSQKSGMRNFRGIEVPWPTAPRFDLDFSPGDLARYLPPG